MKDATFPKQRQKLQLFVKIKESKELFSLKIKG